jgi:hypothetical protein
MAGRRERQQGGGFASRLREVVDVYGSTSALAKTIERSEGAVRKWLRGESEPNVTDLRSLCGETHTSIEWLVTGRGLREAPLSVGEPEAEYESGGPKPLDHLLLENVIRALEEELVKVGLKLPIDKRSMLMVTLYELSLEFRKVDPEAVTRLVRLAR